MLQDSIFLLHIFAVFFYCLELIKIALDFLHFLHQVDELCFTFFVVLDGLVQFSVFLLDYQLVIFALGF